MPKLRKNTWQPQLIAAILCAMWPTLASAGLLKLADELVKAPNLEPKAFKNIVSDDKLYTGVISDLLAKTPGKMGTGAMRQALRMDLTQFITEAGAISWSRSDLVDYLSTLTKRNCSLNVSCQIAFDLSSKQIPSFLDELSSDIQGALSTRLATLGSQMSALEKELKDLPADAPIRKAKQDELDKVKNDWINSQDSALTANRLRDPAKAGEESAAVCR